MQFGVTDDVDEKNADLQLDLLTSVGTVNIWRHARFTGKCIRKDFYKSGVASEQLWEGKAPPRKLARFQRGSARALV
jgi:hypothetical protein